jgi:membrane protein
MIEMLMAEKLSSPIPLARAELYTAAGVRFPHSSLASLRWSDFKAVVALSLAEWNKHKAPRLGASLAFYTLLSLAPLLLVVVSITGMVLGQKDAQAAIVAQVSGLVGRQEAKTVQLLLEGSRNTTHGLIATVFGLLTLLFGASGVLIELRDALNTLWEVPTAQLAGIRWVFSYINERLFSFALVLAIGFVLVVSLALNTVVAALGSFSESYLPAPELVLHVLNSAVSFLIITFLFAAIYKFVPDLKIEWHDVLLGGAVTATLFTVGKLLLGLYLGKASFASTYGATASIVVLVVWVYYSGQIFFLGAEFTRVFPYRHGSQPERPPGQAR